MTNRKIVLEIPDNGTLLNFNHNHSTKPCVTKVEFIEGLSTQQVIEIVTGLESPQVILWYIGCNGLREAGVQFYKEALISPILRECAQAAFWLLDLTAWAAFRQPFGSIQRSSSCSKRINSFCHDRFTCISASELFEMLQNLNGIELIKQIKGIIERDALWKQSEIHPKSNISIGELFSSNCPAVEEIYSSDASKAYSLFQYLEGCLLVCNLTNRLLSQKQTNAIEVVFALPNNEIDYYLKDSSLFHQDLEFFLNQLCDPSGAKGVCLAVKMVGFNYGARMSDRPYNAIGQVIKSNKLNFSSIVEYD